MTGDKNSRDKIMIAAGEAIIRVLPRDNANVNVSFITVCMQLSDKILGKSNRVTYVSLSSLVSFNILK